ncbi:hypothetical protein BpHYR1_047384 [Brachionus plicatilis]|uniref:Transmembrane protein n=1 Tax=Brachionus plicatilis TaxID=10195 RepID=A0A3M7REC8_BRAPC|nr:hypothetical protein BpHYR1_047384 [Brachionus plicatilis]
MSERQQFVVGNRQQRPNTSLNQRILRIVILMVMFYYLDILAPTRILFYFETNIVFFLSQLNKKLFLFYFLQRAFSRYLCLAINFGKIKVIIISQLLKKEFFDFEIFFSSLKNKLIYLSIRIFIKTEKFIKQEYLIEHPSKFISKTKI